MKGCECELVEHEYEKKLQIQKIIQKQKIIEFT